MTTSTDSARQQAEQPLQHIRELMEWLDHASECNGNLEGPIDKCGWLNNIVREHLAHPGDYWDVHNTDVVTNAIHDNALDIEINYGWHSAEHIGQSMDKFMPEQFRILLCTGGPAVRIMGELDEHGQPDTAQLEYQDWGTPWTELEFVSNEADEALLRYSQQFYFGE